MRRRCTDLYTPDINIDISEEQLRKLEAFPVQYEIMKRQTCEEVALEMIQYFQSIVPVITGNLRDSIGYEITDDGVELYCAIYGKEYLQMTYAQFQGVIENRLMEKVRLYLGSGAV